MLSGALAVAILSAIILPVDFTADAGDGINHYWFSKNAFRNPSNLMDLWAKPLFTFFSAPFAQFGLKGMHFFNILCAVLTGLLCVATAKKLGMKFSWLAFFILLSIPVYFHLLCSAMTEPFFGLVLISSIFLFLDDKTFLSATVASLLPFARQEGYLFLPVMLVAFLMIRRYRVIPFLLAGPFLFSLAGYFFREDFWWLIHDDPYKGAAHIYGSGELLHFVKHSELIFGFAVQASLFIGLAVLSFALIQRLKNKDLSKDKKIITLFIIIAGYFFVFFAAHSVMWWRGSHGSLGLLRVMAGIAPLAGILSLTGIQFLLSFVKNKTLSVTLALIFTAICYLVLATRSGFPPQKGQEELLTEKAAQWIKENDLAAKKIFYSSPWLPYSMDINPAEKEKTEELSASPALKKGDLVVWDAHFGPNENGFPESRFLADSSFSILLHLEPEKKFTTLGNKNYEIYVLEKK